MNASWLALLQQQFRGDCLTDEPLAPLTSWRVGGAAELLVRPRDLQDLTLLQQVLRRHDVPYCVLGGGSNVLIADSGIAGVVVQLSYFDTIEELDGQRLKVGAGCRLNTLVRYATSHGYAGVESLAGIPGTVGGAVAVNAGARGQQIGDVVESAQVFDGHELQCWDHDQFNFAYRSSCVEAHQVVVEVVLRYEPASSLRLCEMALEATQHRARAHAVGGPNAGSVFKNPPGQQAWQLIEQCGLRGVRCGQAQVSPHHTNFIINHGGATAEEIRRLIHRVQQTVLEQTGVVLEPEVRMMGAFGGWE